MATKLQSLAAKSGLFFLLTTPVILSAAPANDPRSVITQSVKVIEDLAIAARPHVTDANTRLQDMKTRASKLAGIQKNMESELQLAKTTHTANENQLKAANASLYGAQTGALALPSVADLHGRLLGQVDVFSSQAIDQFSDDYLGGDIVLALRPAMSRVINSEDQYVMEAGATVNIASTFLATVKGELLTLAANPSATLARYGTDHYLSLLLERLDAVRVGVSNVSTFFQGVNINGQSEYPNSECLPFELTTFSQDLAQVREFARTLPYRPLVPDGPSFIAAMSGLLVTYNGETGNPGWISHWGACISSMVNNINVLNSDISRELLRGNLELARQLDIQRADLDFKRVIYTIERDIIAHRRDQLNAILSSASAQASKDNLIAFPDAWRQTVYANIDNLEYISVVFPKLLKSSIELLNRAQDEIESLQLISDPVELASQMRVVASKLDAIQAKGYSLLKEQFTSVHESLHVMSIGIASGERILSEAIDVYSLATQTKFDFWSGQVQALPDTISQAEADVASANEAFAQSLAFIQDLQPRLEAFKASKLEFTNALNAIVSRVTAARFNPIYNGLLAMVLDNASFNPKVDAMRKPIESAARAFLARFQGIADGTIKKSCRPGVKGCPARIRITSAVAKAIQREAKLIRLDIRSAIDEVSLNLIEQPLFDSLEQLNSDLVSLENP